MLGEVRLVPDLVVFQLRSIIRVTQIRLLQVAALGAWLGKNRCV